MEDLVFSGLITLGRSNEILPKWAEKAGLERGSAIGIGAGEMVKMAPIGHGPSHNLGIAIEQFISDICEQKSRDTIFVEPNFPRILYKAAAHAGWRAQVRKNGLKVSDIRRKVIPEINR